MKWQEHFKSTLPGGKTKPSLTCAEARELAGESWPDVSDQCPTLYAVWAGGATPQQALHMVSVILPPKAAA